MQKYSKTFSATLLSVFAAFSFLLSSPFFSHHRNLKDNTRQLLSVFGIGAPRSVISSPESHLFSYEVQLRDANGLLIGTFVPLLHRGSLDSQVFRFQLLQTDSDLFLDTVCPRVGSLLKRGPDDQVLIFEREQRLRSFEKFDPKNRGLLSLEILASC
jgi:hypothetical protein